jgi:hypothetical protein
MLVALTLESFITRGFGVSADKWAVKAEVAGYRTALREPIVEAFKGLVRADNRGPVAGRRNRKIRTCQWDVEW